MNRIVYVFIGFFIVLADQLSKWFVSEQLLRAHVDDTPLGLMQWLTEAPARLSYVEISALPFFNLVMVWNQGVSFGLFNGASDGGRWMLIVLSSVIVLWLAAWLWRTQSRLQSTALAMVIGGALGNVIDRFRFGAVIDFLDFHAFGWHYPAFNLADSCIVVGVVLLMIYAVVLEKKEGQSP